MRKIIAAMNMTLDAVCDHRAGIPDEELHDHYTKLLDQGEAILYGRITYQLMDYWRSVLEIPSDNAAMNDFAAAINRIPKIVFSHQIHDVDWPSARLSMDTPEQVIHDFKKTNGKDIFVGSPSLIIQLLNAQLIDELKLCIHPVVAGGGMRLFDLMQQRIVFRLNSQVTFQSGAVVMNYTPIYPTGINKIE